MNATCAKCGTALSDQEAFCPNCGTKRAQPAASAGNRFCAYCGTALDPGMKFCSKCGKPVVEAESPKAPEPPAPAPPPPAPAAPIPVAAPRVEKPATPSNAPAGPSLPAARAETPAVPSPQAAIPSAPPPVPPAEKKSNPLLKIAVIVLGILALITVAGIGTCVYVGYRVKHKVTELASEMKNGPGQAPAAAGAAKYESRPAADCEYKDRTGFDDYVKTAASASIPLKAQLTLTDIWTDFKQNMQDVEILHTVDGIQSSAIEVSVKRLDGKHGDHQRRLCIADMIHGHELETMFGDSVPDTLAGATMFTLSTDTFKELKTKGSTEVALYDAYRGGSNTLHLFGFRKGTLSRVEPQDVPYNIIVNGDQKDLPCIHVKGSLSGHPYEAWILDDEANPLVLKITCAEINWHITYVKITFPVEKKIEQELAQTGHAEIYGIYFDFNSAKLRPESAPVLKEISEALKNNPNWKIKIDGHTDNVGGDAYNMQLSQRRSEAVKQALISEYGISADRMTPEGFGASRPKATNSTIEGRALNRRVELVRE
jgi:OmpA family protein/double zinc ribbon protein